MKIIEGIYEIEIKNDVYIKENWKYEMYDVETKNIENENSEIINLIKKFGLFEKLLIDNDLYKKIYKSNLFDIKSRLHTNNNIKKNIKSKYNFGYRIFICDDKKIKYNKILKQTIEVEYETGDKIDIGTRTLTFMGVKEFIQRMENYEKYRKEQKLQLENGLYTIVVDPELTGLLVHEVIGHSFEYDVWNENEWLQNILIPGKKIMNANISIIDNPKFKEGYGSYEYDDEGNIAFPTYLIKNGVVMEFLRNMRFSNKKHLSCNARRLNIWNDALIRMSNTYMLKGERPINSIIQEIDKGIFFKGSSNCIYSGIAIIIPREAYLILNGKIAGPIYKGRFYVSILDFMDKIKELSKEFMIYGGGFGGCGKKNQWPLDIGSGGPFIKMEQIYCDFKERNG